MIARITATNPQITDYTEGGVTRSIVEALGEELQDMDEQVYVAIRDAINVGIYKSFNFPKLPASYALGFVRVTATPALGAPALIPAGSTIFQVPGSPITYISTADATMPVSPNFVDIPVRASIAGSVGNTPQNTITAVLTGLGFPATVTNLAPLINGTDQESDAARFNRFQDYIAGLSKGTKFALRAIAKTITILDVNGNILEGVQQALVVETFRLGVSATFPNGSGFLGLVQVYIDNGSGTASAALIALVNQALLGYVDIHGAEHDGVIAAGVNLQVLAVIPFVLNINGRIVLLSGSDPTVVIPAAQTALIAYIETLQVGDVAIWSQLEATVINAGGVADVSIDQPALSVTPPFGKRITPGAIVFAVVDESVMTQ